MLSINASSTSSDSSNATDSLALSGAAAAGSSQAVAAAAASIEEVTFPHWVSFLLESARGQKIMEQWLSPYINTCVMCDLE